MGNEEKSTTNRPGTLAVIQIVMLICAFVIGVLGIIRITDMLRITIYACQCLTCIFILLFGVFKFKDPEGKLLKTVFLAYALLEGLRAALLNVTGVSFAVGVAARFILVLLACSCVLLSERACKETGKKTATEILVLEIILYVVFLAGFKGVMLGRINRFLPLVGVLIAGAIVLQYMGKEADKES